MRRPFPAPVASHRDFIIARLSYFAAENKDVVESAFIALRPPGGKSFAPVILKSANKVGQ